MSNPLSRIWGPKPERFDPQARHNYWGEEGEEKSPPFFEPESRHNYWEKDADEDPDTDEEE